MMLAANKCFAFNPAHERLLHVSNITCSVDCYDPSCSDHGVCVDGECRCDRGWMGKFCSEKDLVCLSACGGHGTFDAFTKSCICDPGWSGTDCSTGKFILFVIRARCRIGSHSIWCVDVVLSALSLLYH